MSALPARLTTFGQGMSLCNDEGTDTSEKEKQNKGSTNGLGYIPLKGANTAILLHLSEVGLKQREIRHGGFELTFSSEPRDDEDDEMRDHQSDESWKVRVLIVLL